MYVFTPHTDAIAPAVTKSVAYPNAFTPYSASLKLSTGCDGAGDARSFCQNTSAVLRCGDGDGAARGKGATGVLPPTVDVRRGGGGASCSDRVSVVFLCRRRRTIGTTSAAVVKASYPTMQAHEKTLAESKAKQK